MSRCNEHRYKPNHPNIRKCDICLNGEIEQLRAKNARLRQALETIRDAGLEPIDPAYREYARAALNSGEGE